MVDDHDRCEWVNVSSGTGSPGLSRVVVVVLVGDGVQSVTGDGMVC